LASKKESLRSSCHAARSARRVRLLSLKRGGILGKGQQCRTAAAIHHCNDRVQVADFVLELGSGSRSRMPRELDSAYCGWVCVRGSVTLSAINIDADLVLTEVSSEVIADSHSGRGAIRLRPCGRVNGYLGCSRGANCEPATLFGSPCRSAASLLAAALDRSPSRGRSCDCVHARAEQPRGFCEAPARRQAPGLLLPNHAATARSRGAVPLASKLRAEDASASGQLAREVDVRIPGRRSVLSLTCRQQMALEALGLSSPGEPRSSARASPNQLGMCRTRVGQMIATIAAGGGAGDRGAHWAHLDACAEYGSAGLRARMVTSRAAPHLWHSACAAAGY
jgi:hypothetical protein